MPVRIFSKIKLKNPLISASGVNDPGRSKPSSFISREKILEFALDYKTPGHLSEDEALEKLWKRLNHSKDVIRSKPHRKIIIYSSVAAASVLLLLLFSLFINKNRISTVVTDPGQKLSFYLPDSSRVTLNSASVLKYSPEKWNAGRTMELEGEAFFEIKKGSRCEVLSNHYIVTVLGTSFNVYARVNQYRVSCYTGKIQVKIKENSCEQFITPGYETYLNHNKMLAEPRKFNSDEITGWQRGEFYFHNEPLIHVLQELARQFNIVIHTNEIQPNNRYFTGCFFSNNLNQALKLVCDPMQLEYSVIGNAVTLRNKTE